MSSRKISERNKRQQTSVAQSKDCFYTNSNDDDEYDEFLQNDHNIRLRDIYNTPKKAHNTPSSRRSQRLLSATKVNYNEDSAEKSRSIRKSLRNITPNKRYTEYFETSPTKSVSKRKPKTYEISSDDGDFDTKIEEVEEDEEMHANIPIQKSTNLFENVLDVDGKEMYAFNTPRKRGSMVNLAKNSPRTSKTLINHIDEHKSEALLLTPKVKIPISDLAGLKIGSPVVRMKSEASRNLMKTPHHIRNKLKTEISKLIDNETDTDFSADESEYQPSSNEENESLSSSSDDADSEQGNEDNIQHKIDMKITKTVCEKTSSSLLQTPSKSRIRRNVQKKSEDYIPECEDYFTVHSKTKTLTSDHTLDHLKNSRLPTDRLFSLISTLKLSNSHEEKIKSLLQEYKTYFTKWMYIMNEGYNIILYGLGSKRSLLQEFHKEILKDSPVIVVNGFFPSLTIKDVLSAITNDMLDLNLNTANYNETINAIEDEFSNIPEMHLFIIVHNIDGMMLRNSKSQEILSRLAKISNIHLIASIDHINTPLLWDHTKLGNFNFSWWDVTTMLPYSDETANENSLLVKNSGDLALSSLRNVFKSLTTNAKGIYMIIVKYQLENKRNSNYCGIQFKDLYWNCREAFLVSSDLALRAQLTEFSDHKLIKTKRNIDGAEHLMIPIETKLLQQFLNEQQQE